LNYSGVHLRLEATGKPCVILLLVVNVSISFTLDCYNFEF